MRKIENKEIETQSEIAPSELLSQADIVVFDMDGTLYLLDGDENRYKNSTLNKKVLDNTRKFIMEMENISEEAAETMIKDIFNKKEYLSVYLSNRYKIDKTDVFNATWNINPDGILCNYENSQKVIKQISNSEKYLILLTSAPQIWQKKVTSLLDIDLCFNKIIYGDKYKEKKEVFMQISIDFPQMKILSIGDQYESDIKPALDLGMSAFQVKHPDDLLLLLK